MNKDIDVFEPVKLGSIVLNNRVFRSATDESLADDEGSPTESLIKLYERLAKGGIGCIITGFMGVMPSAKADMKGMSMIDSDDKITSYQAMVKRVHDAGTPIIAQIAHCGRHGVAKKKGNVNKLSTEEIGEIIEAFIAAAVRTKKAGFDGVELHCAHGYLLSEFLSPHTNKRNDEWGGSEEGRFRIVKMIVEGIKEKTGDYPVLVKINGSEKSKDGIKIKDSASIAKRMEQCGVDAVDVSCGMMTEGFVTLRGEVPYDMIAKEYPVVKDIPKVIKKVIKPVVKKVLKSPGPQHLYNVPAAQEIKKNVNIPVIVVGGIRTVDDIEMVINEKNIDFVSMARALILEPNLIQKFKEQKSKCARCIECNYCLIGINERPLRCYYGKIPQ